MPMLGYSAPSTVEDAVRILAGASGGAKVLSGGTDLLVQLRSGRLKPDLIVDTKHIPGIFGIREEDGGFVIGAATSGAMIGEQRPAAGLARHGRGRQPDRLDPDPGPRLARRQSVQRLAGRRQRAAADRRARDLRGRRPQRAARGAGREHRHRARPHLARSATSSSSSFACRSAPPRSADAYLRFIPRTEMDIAVVGAGVNVTLDAAGICTDARVVLGAVAPTAVLVAEAAAALIGHKLDDATLAALDAAARRACKPINDKRGTIEYRTKVAGVMARRAAAIAFERAGERQ